MIAFGVFGFYMLAGIILAFWAWESYAGKQFGHYGRRFNMAAFLIYALLWPFAFAKDWRRFLNDTFGTRL